MHRSHWDEPVLHLCSPVLHSLADLWLGKQTESRWEQVGLTEKIIFQITGHTVDTCSAPVLTGHCRGRCRSLSHCIMGSVDINYNGIEQNVIYPHDY